MSSEKQSGLGLGPAATTHTWVSAALGGLAPLRIPAFRLFYAGQSLSVCGTWMQDVALVWLVWRATHDQFVVGIVATCRYGTALLMTLPASAAADRFSRRKLLLGANSLALVAATLLGLVALSEKPPIWQLCLLFSLSGMAMSLEMPTRHAFLASLVPPPLIPKAVALNAMSFNCARVIGPSIGAVLIAMPSIGVAGCCFLNAASYIAVVVALAIIRVDERPAKFDAHAPSGFLRALTDPRIRRPLLLAVSVGIFGWSIPIVLPSFAEVVLHGGGRLYSQLMAVIGAGAFCAACFLATGFEPRSTRLYQYSGLGCWLGALGALSLCTRPFQALCIMWLAGFGMVVFATTSNTAIQMAVPDEMRARAMGLWALVYLISEPFGNAGAGALAKYLGPVLEIRISAAAMAVIGAGMLASEFRAESAHTKLSQDYRVAAPPLHEGE